MVGFRLRIIPTGGMGMGDNGGLDGGCWLWLLDGFGLAWVGMGILAGMGITGDNRIPVDCFIYYV